MKSLKDIVLERLVLSKSKNTNDITPIEQFIDILNKYKEFNDNGFDVEDSDAYGETGIIPQTEDGEDVKYISCRTHPDIDITAILLYIDYHGGNKIVCIDMPEKFDYFIKDILGGGNQKDGELFYSAMIKEMEEKLNAKQNK